VISIAERAVIRHHLTVIQTFGSELMHQLHFATSGNCLAFSQMTSW
jgi:hypothetical protein